MRIARSMGHRSRYSFERLEDVGEDLVAEGGDGGEVDRHGRASLFRLSLGYRRLDGERSSGGV